MGTYGAPGSHPQFNGTTRIKGIAFPEGTDSVLFFGRTGIGPYCYGDADECGDPANPYRGEHAYPYRMYVWAYDAHDLEAARAGSLQPWQVEPYAVWDLGIDGTSEFSGHAASNPATGRIFVSEVTGNGDLPLIHVFTTGLAQPAPTVTASDASPPEQLQVARSSRSCRDQPHDRRHGDTWRTGREVGDRRRFDLHQGDNWRPPGRTG